MRLIGMLDSPYVRRVAISLKFMDLSFVHEPVSVFRDYDAFAAINPIVKAPTFVTDDGVPLMDSTLILDYLEPLARADRRLMPMAPSERARALRLIGLALAASDKSVQMVYELNLRPPEKRHQPWLDRVRRQILAAYELLESAIDPGGTWLLGERPLQADISVAVAWRFTQDLLPDLASPANHPALASFSQRAELRPEFLAYLPD